MIKMLRMSDNEKPNHSHYTAVGAIRHPSNASGGAYAIGFGMCCKVDLMVAMKGDDRMGPHYYRRSHV